MHGDATVFPTTTPTRLTDFLDRGVLFGHKNLASVTYLSEDMAADDQQTNFRYRVFGLCLQANRHISKLATLGDAGDVDVRVLFTQKSDGETDSSSSDELWYASQSGDSAASALKIWRDKNGEHFRLSFADGAEFLIDRSGQQLRYSSPPSLADGAVESYLLGPVLSFVLLLRGVTCLHASAVAFRDHAIAFIGPENAGKSTVAAALAGRGYAVLADDLVSLSPVDEAEQSWKVEAGFPYLHLRSTSLSLLPDADSLQPALCSTSDKSWFDLDLSTAGYRFQQQPLKLGAIYFLDRSINGVGDPFVETMRCSEALMALVANTWVTRVLDSAMRSVEFRSLGRLAANVPVHRLHYGSRAADVSRLCDVAVEDFASMITSSTIS